MPVRRTLVVVVYAAALAWLEAATVAYLRLLVDRVQPYQPAPLPMNPHLVQIELVREAATLVMLAVIGWLAGRTAFDRLGYSMIAFGTWDILYYCFLRPTTGWPMSVLDWDVLFLIPLPWWGPVLAPVLLAGWMIVFGAMLLRGQGQRGPGRAPAGVWAWAIAGSTLALVAFLLPSIMALASTGPAVGETLPGTFAWVPYLAGLACLALAVWRLARRPAAGSVAPEPPS
jgi:hypothetical protein